MVERKDLIVKEKIIKITGCLLLVFALIFNINVKANDMGEGNIVEEEISQTQEQNSEELTSDDEKQEEDNSTEEESSQKEEQESEELTSDDEEQEEEKSSEESLKEEEQDNPELISTGEAVVNNEVNEEELSQVQEQISEEPKEEVKEIEENNFSEDNKEEITESNIETNNNNVDEIDNTKEEYKVYFTYDGYKSSIIGGEEFFISDLLNSLKININLDDIVNISISDNNLFKVSKLINNEWTIDSLKSFDTEEKIIIELSNGNKYIIDVTDPAGYAPEHNKTLTPNGEIVTKTDEDGNTKEEFEEDGTYKLSLTVTGESEIKKESSGINVIVIYDVSSSMIHYYAPYEKGSIGGTGAWTTSGYTKETSNGSGYFYLYKEVNGEYIKLGLEEDYDGPVYRKNTDNTFTEHTGQRFLTRRAEASEVAVNKFVSSLFAYQSDTKPENIEVSFIQFANGVTDKDSPNYTSDEKIGTKTIVPWTSDKDDITYYLTDNLAERYDSGTHTTVLKYMSGTNYESALQQAIKELNNADADPTFVIFITDGEPSESVSKGNLTDKYYDENGNLIDAHNEPGRKVFSEDALDEAIIIQNYNTKTHSVDADNSNTTLYGIYAFGDAYDFLDDVIYYSINGYERPEAEGGVTGQTVKTQNYYNAADTTELTNAISSIFDEIITVLGYSDTTIIDGTTSGVKLDSGSLSDGGLLDVDDTSFEYYLSLHVDKGEDNKYSFSMYNPYEGDEYTYNVTVNNDSVTIIRDDKSSTYKGTISNNILRILWGNYNERLETNFYYAAPQATFVDDQVKWDLNDLGTLLHGVTYEVTFDVWPSQTTYDLIADLKNGIRTYDSLSDEVKTYLRKTNTNDSDTKAEYTLLTNIIGEAKITYVDTRVSDKKETADYKQPEPVGTSVSEMLAIKKVWNGKKEEDVNLVVTRDNNPWYQVELDEDGNGQAYISLGIMTIHDNEITLKTSGREYSFMETGNNAYHWEISTDIVRPMLINNHLTLLVKTTEKEINDNGYTIIKITNSNNVSYKVIKGHGTYDAKENEKVEISYYNVKDNLDTSKIEANVVNDRRSNLDIVKNVTSYNNGESFTFKIKVNSAKSNNPSDEYVWFSVADTTTGSYSPIKISTSANLELDKDGKPTYYYYVNSGLTFDENGNFVSCGEGEEFTVELKHGYSLRILNLLSGSTYSVMEVVPDNYNLTISSSNNTNYEVDEENSNKVNGVITTTQTNYNITYTNDSLLRNIKVYKIWEDFDNKYETRPKEITINLYADDIKIDSVKLNDNNKWTFIFNNMKVYDGTKKITYTIKEEAIELYEAIVDGDMEKGFKVTNYYSPKGDGNPPVDPEIPDDNPPTPSNNPQTSDNMIIYVITLIISIITIISCFKYYKKYF